MKMLVIGAGPMGSLYAARLFEAGLDVTLMDRGKRLEEIKAQGVILEDSATGEREAYAVPVASSFGADDDYDLVVVVMRKNQALELLPSLAENDGVGTFLFLMNSAAGPGELTNVLGADRVLLGLPSSGGFPVGGGAMRVMPAPQAPLPIGEPDGSIRDRTVQVGAILNRMRDKKVQIRKDMDAYLVTHLAALSGNLGVYAANLDARRFSETRDAIVLGLRAQEEALAAQRAAGIPVCPVAFRVMPLIPEPILATAMKHVARTDLFEVGIVGHAAQARDEIAHLIEELRERLRPGGVPTPALDDLASYVRGERMPLPRGSQGMSMRWGGVVALGAGLVGSSLLYAWRSSRKA